MNEEIEKEIAIKDEEFTKLLEENQTDQENQGYAELMRRHLAEVEELRRKRLAEKKGLDTKLRDKLDMRRGTGGVEEVTNI